MAASSADRPASSCSLSALTFGVSPANTRRPSAVKFQHIPAPVALVPAPADETPADEVMTSPLGDLSSATRSPTHR